MKDPRTIEEKIIDWISAELSDCWSARRIDYDQHKCNGQDGKDISFTKKDFESVFERARKRFVGEKK